VVKFLHRIVFGTDLINEWSAAIDIDKRDAVDYSKEWIAANEATVNTWLGR
jgi:ABC-type proline/glycine betaine transport system substrate-binding protein